MRTVIVLALLASCGAKPGRHAYGSWESPITARDVTQQTSELDEPALTADAIYWLQSQPDGRSALMVRRDGAVRERLPGVDVRTEVHAYGGGSYVVDGTRLLYTDAKDQRLYVVDGSARARAVTPAGKAWYAGCAIDRPRDRAICVRDDASAGGMPIDSIVAVDLTGASPPTSLVTGADFYAQIKISPDGKRLAYLSWNFPNMPWDGTDLWLVDIGTDGKLGTPEHVAGGRVESINQPEWSPDGDLYFTSDRSGYWNLHRWRDRRSEQLWPLTGDVGNAAWTIDATGYAFASSKEVVAAVTVKGLTSLHVFDVDKRVARPLFKDTVAKAVRGGHGRAVAIVASPDEPMSVVEIELASGTRRVLARSADTSAIASVLSLPESITCPGTNGESYAQYFPPHNMTTRALTGELPPLIVAVHGGPTGHWYLRLDPEVLFFTSRGFAYAKINHGGSTGYGRAYRQRLNGQWGVVDVDDSIACAKALAARGSVDPKRIVIRGGSAGGFTTLAALAFRDFFRAGASWFGISDLDRLQVEGAESDKFESQYNFSLLAPYPERRDLYVARSPINAADKISAPVIFFQGSEDPVVPPNQSRLMFDAIKRRGLPTAFLEFPGEKHGFRKAENNARALDAELYFYRRVLGIPVSGAAPIAIENLR